RILKVLTPGVLDMFKPVVERAELVEMVGSETGFSINNNVASPGAMSCMPPDRTGRLRGTYLSTNRRLSNRLLFDIVKPSSTGQRPQLFNWAFDKRSLGYSYRKGEGRHYPVPA